jgi:hypothetical protein
MGLIYSTPYIHYRILILCPVNVVANWGLEFSKWLPHSLQGRFIVETINSGSRPADRLGINIKKTLVDNSTRFASLRKWCGAGGVCIIGKELFCKVVEEAQKSCTSEGSAPSASAAETPSQGTQILEMLINPGTSCWFISALISSEITS